MDFLPLVQVCVERPSFHFMRRAFEDYRFDRAPCKAGIPNQCAVRTSVALVRSGCDLSGFGDPRRVHRGRASCRLQCEHVVGARELAVHLRRFLPEQRFEGRLAATARSALAHRTGIVYFDNVFAREPGGAQTGDHIDLWDGHNYYNELLGIGAGGNAGARTDLFARAGAVWFFTLQ
jgi:hypothetical protein